MVHGVRPVHAFNVVFGDRVVYPAPVNAASNPPFLVVGTESDNPFAIDIGRYAGQREDIADLISLKTFANSEFCPRFIGEIGNNPGYSLEGRTVVIVSTASAWHSRDELAMRSLLTARAARDNGAAAVVLLEPDLFYSAQDRGPRLEHGCTDFERDEGDRRKFEGQPFSARLYAQMLAMAGVSRVVTIHNHSASVGHEFEREFKGRYLNLSPSAVLSHYLRKSDVLDTADEGAHIVVCAPDDGALDFAWSVKKRLGLSGARLLSMEKERTGERSVESRVSSTSEVGLGDIEGRDVVIVDDMVRTGGTILQCSQILRSGRPRRVILAVTHFYSSGEVRENLALPFIDEIITTNSVPTILNRDTQGRLRRKLVVLKLERWIAGVLLALEQGRDPSAVVPDYGVDMSTKNPRWHPSTTS